MLHINKVKRILRAKNGSQIPKFLNGGSPNETVLNWADYLFNPDLYPFGPISYKNRKALEDLNSILNPNTIGSEIPTDITNDLNNKSGYPKLNNFETLVLESAMDKALKEYLKMSGFEVPKLTKPVFLDDIDKAVKRAKLREFKTKAGDFISKNAIPIGMGLDYIGSYFDNTINSKGFDTAIGGLDTFGNFTSTINPKMGLYTKAASTLIKGANSLLGKDFNYKLDNNLLARSGASYLGYAAEANRLASKSGKIGFLNFGKHSSLEDKKQDLGIDARKISDLLDANDDKLQASRNDLIYTKYNNKVNGLDNKIARFNKLGGKLIDKITLVKSRNLVKQYINSDTLQIEEFAKGGTLDWEPIIEVFEPIIEIQEFLKGGLIEELYDFSQESEDYPQEYKDFKNSLPKNQRLTPESEYRTYLYWQLWGKPKNFQYTLNHPDEDGNYMYTWDDSDNSYHGNSIAWKDRIGYFIKPKNHPTLKYELDYYNKGLITENGGKQRPAKEQELKGWLNFKNNYDLVEDGNFYKYVPKLTNKNEWEPTIEILDTHIVGLPEYKSGGKTRTLEELIEYAKKENPRFIQRLSEDSRGIEFIDDEGNKARGSHYLEYSELGDGAVVYPRIQEVNGELKHFLDWREALKNALNNNNVLKMTPEEALLFSKDYKQGWPKFFFKEVYDYYKDYDLSNAVLIRDNLARTEGNKIYVNTDEDAVHELWHFLSQNKPNEKYKEFYDNLNDARITELGGDLNFVKRHEGDPGHFYHPSELEARIMAAKFKSLGLKYTKDFFKNLRSDENKYGYNMRDLLYMFNDENLEKIFNLKKGGTLGEELEIPEIEETTQKNIIPEGALHKNKHHIEHTEGLTKKGIPVVDNDGNLQAEVEKEEIIFSLEVTKKLEELYKDYYDSDKSLKEKDEAAIEAGKLLVYQILFNTDDRTGLIKRCEEGGKL